MKKNIAYLIILTLIALATYWFVFKEHKQSFSITEVNINVDDTADVTKIFISNMLGQKITYNRTPQGWIGNDSFAIKQDNINNILECLQIQEAVAPVPMPKHDNVLRNMSANNNKVEVYVKNKLHNTFYVYNNPTEENLTILLTEGAQRPYIVRLPLKDLFVGRRYVTDITEIRTRKVFPVQKENISYIDITYKDSVQYNYTAYNSNPYKVIGSEQVHDSLNIKRVNSYFGFIPTIEMFGYEVSQYLIDTAITHGVMLGTATVVCKDSSKHILSVYFRPLYKGSKGTITIGKKEFDNDSFFGMLNNRDFILINREMTEKVFRTHHEFFEKDKIPAPQK